VGGINFPDISRKLPGKFPGHFPEMYGKCPGIFLEISQTFPRNFPAGASLQLFEPI